MGREVRDDDPGRLSLAELAAAANRRREKQRAYDEEGLDMSNGDGGGHWMIRMAKQFGIGALFALLLLIWLQGSVDKRLDQTMAAAQSSALKLDAFILEMRAATQEQARQNEIALLVNRQTCQNTAKTTQAGEQCWATKEKR